MTEGVRVETDSEMVKTPGSYWKSKDGTWYVHPAVGFHGNLSKHEVTEHEDGTITVSPSTAMKVAGTAS
mgnify:CR=1 FL=1